MPDAMTDMSTLLGESDLNTTQPGPAPGPQATPATVLSPVLPPGVHPRDRAVPTVPGQVPPDDKVAGEGNLGPQGRRTAAPWSTENADAVPINQRAAAQWSANLYSMAVNSQPLQVAGRLKGCVSVKLWVPSTSTGGVLISPDSGDLTQGAGVPLNVGDSIELFTEATIWAAPQAGVAATLNVVRLFNPPGGGLGLSAASH